MIEELRGRVRTLGLVPARGGSTRVPRKNLARARRPHARPPRARDRARRRLLRDGRAVSERRRRDPRRGRTGSTWSRCARPPELATETARARDFARHALRGARRVRRARDRPVHLAVHRARGRRAARSSCSSAPAPSRSSRCRVADAAHHPLKLKRLVGDRLSPYLEDDRLTPSHELERLWVRNGSVYVFRRDVVLERGLEADDVRGYEMPPERSFDIDTGRGPRLRASSSSSAGDRS